MWGPTVVKGDGIDIRSFVEFAVGILQRRCCRLLTMRLTVLFAALALALTGGLARAAEIRLGSLSLDWPPGYALKSTQSPFELSGPTGAKVLVTVMSPGPSATGSPEGLARLNESLERLLTEQAARAGQVVLPLSTRILPDGTRLQSVGSQVSGLFRSGYFLQYTLVSRSGRIALLTFEGQGDALSEHEALQSLFSSAQWSAGEASPQEQAAFTERVAALLRARLAAEAVVVAEPLTLKIGDMRANLDRVHGFCRSNASACDAELERYVNAVVDMQTQAATPPSRDALRVVVRTTEFADGAERSMAGKAGFIRRPLAEGLVAMVMLDAPRSARLMGEADSLALGLSADAAFALGQGNLRRQLKPLAQVARPVVPGSFGTLDGDFYESGRVVLHEDWAALARAHKGVLIVALPAKNLLIYSADDSPAGLEALRQRARDVGRRSPGPLSDVLLRWTPAGWEAVR